MNTPDSSSNRAARTLATAVGALLIALLWSVLQLWGLEKTPFHTKGEPREALVVWEMVNGGGWILPRRNGIELPSKPPFFHWLGAGVSKLTGEVDEWSTRLPSSLLSLGGVIATYVVGVVFFGTRAALLGALVLLTSFELQRTATSARVDMALTCGLSIVLAAFLLLRHGGRRGCIFVFYAGMACACLAKGPVGAALPLLVTAALCAAQRSLAPARGLHLGKGVFAVAAITAVWYGLAFLQGGYEFFARHVLYENIERFIGHEGYKGGHQHPAPYLIGAFLLGFLPWSLFLPLGGIALWRDRATLHRQDVRLTLVIWTVTIFGFYSLATSKRGVYLLPVYPAVALLLGWAWDFLLRDGARFRRLDSFTALCGATLTFLATVLLAFTFLEATGLPALSAAAKFAHGEAREHIAAIADALRQNPKLSTVTFGAALSFAAAMFLAARAQRWGWVFTALVSFVAAVTVSIHQLVLPAVAHTKTRKHFIAEVRRVAGDNLTFYRDFDYGAVFYAGGRIPVWSEPLGPDGPRYLLISEPDWTTLAPRERRHYERVGELTSTSSGNLGRIVFVRRLNGGAPSDIGRDRS